MLCYVEYTIDLAVFLHTMAPSKFAILNEATSTY